METTRKKLRRIRVLQIITGIDVGGAEQYLLTILRIMDRRKFDVAVCYLRGKGMLRGEFEASGIPVFDFSGPWWTILARSRKFFKFVRTGNFDIVHTHLIRATLVGGMFAQFARVKVVFTTEHNVSNWKRRYFVITLFYRWNARRVRRIFAVSRAVRDRIVGVGKVTQEKVEVLPTGVDLSAFTPRATAALHLESSKDRKDWPTIGCIGRFDPRKGQRFLVAALAEVRKELPTARLVLVGDGKNRSAIEAQVKRLGLSQHVDFKGTLRNVRELLKTFDVVVFPSLSEGLPVALLEAMAMGALVVASDVGGIPEAITDRVEGRLVQPGNSSILAKTILEVLSDRKLARTMKLAARAKCRNEFDVRKSVMRLEAVYRESIAASG